MKTKNLLVAMALPALFAACTAEEIVNQADNNALNNRALLGDLVANVEGNVASRASWSEANLAWGAWEADDVFSAALTDPSGDFVAGDKLLTNYVFKKNADGEWTTTSQMVEGLYSFYSYKGIATKNTRDLVKFDITNQEADLDEPTKVLDDHQLFFSPLYKIEAKNTTAENNIALPLQFYPYHSIAAFYIKNSTDQDLKISQIIAKGSFVAKGSIKPAKIQLKGFEYNVCKDGTEYKLWKTEPSATAAGVEYTAKEVKEMWEMSDLSGAEPVNQIVLDCDNWTLAEGEEVIAYMNIPAGAQTEFAVDINVVDADGNAKTIHVTNTKMDMNDYLNLTGDDATEENDKIYTIASTGLNKTSFKRGTATAVFGLKNKQPKAIEIAENNLADASGIYVDTEAALLDLIADGRGDLLVYNAGDLVLNATIADALAENTACNLIFANPIEIEDFENTVELTKVTFLKKVTVKDEYDANEEATEEGTSVVFGEDVNVVAGLEVEAYSTATLANGEYDNVTNKGTMTLYAEGAKITGTLKNEGTLTADKGSAPESEATSRALNLPTISVEGGSVKVIGMDAIVTLKKGNLEYEADVNANGKNIDLSVTKLTIARTSGQNAKLTIGEDVTWTTGAIAVGQAYEAANNAITKKLTVENNGKIEAEGDVHFADLTNNGIIEAKNMYIFGTCTNNNTITIAEGKKLEMTYYTGLVKSGDLNNYGEIYGDVKADKGSNVVAGEGSMMSLVNSASASEACARVNNTAGAIVEVKNGHKYIIYHEFSGESNLKSFLDLNYKRFNINTIVISGTFTMDENDVPEVWKEQCTESGWTGFTKLQKYFYTEGEEFGAAITRLELTDNAILKVNKQKNNSIGFNQIYVSGDVTIQGWKKDDSFVYFQRGAQINLAVGSTVTVNNATVMTGINPTSVTANAKIVCSTEGKTTENEYGRLIEKANADVVDTIENSEYGIVIDPNAIQEED